MENKKGFFNTGFAYYVEVDAWTLEDIYHHIDCDDDYYPETWEGVVVGMKVEDIKKEIENRFHKDDIVHVSYSIVKMIESNSLKDYHCNREPNWDDYYQNIDDDLHDMIDYYRYNI